MPQLITLAENKFRNSRRSDDVGHRREDSDLTIDFLINTCPFNQPRIDRMHREAVTREVPVMYPSWSRTLRNVRAETSKSSARKWGARRAWGPLGAARFTYRSARDDGSTGD